MKLEIDKLLDLETLKEIFIVSNTPLYLYKNFRKNGTVQGLSNRYSTYTLIKFFETAINNQNDNLDRLVSIYSIIIALTFKDYSEIHHFFNKLDSYEIEWSKELKAIFMSSVEITQIYGKNENYRKSTS